MIETAALRGGRLFFGSFLYSPIDSESYPVKEIEALAILSTLPFVGSIKIRLLLSHFGSAEAALHASAHEVESLAGFGPKVAQAWGSWKINGNWQRNLDLAGQMGVQLISFTDPLYPKRLLEISDFPIILYVWGTLIPQDTKSLAVIGTRFSSNYGNQMAHSLSKDLASYGFTIVSGLARGIDTCAHKGALETGRTIAVIGSGLANIYPQENSALGQVIAQKGALISEFPMLTPPDRQNFPQRNRIVSGMTLGALLIEAPEKSGAMITMEKSHSYRRKLYCLPGRADTDHFRGNHRLIKDGSAALIENAADIAADFDDLFGRRLPSKATPPQLPPLEPEERQVYNLLVKQETTFEALLQESSIPVQKLSILLMSLQLKRVIKELPGKVYCLRG